MHYGPTHADLRSPEAVLWHGRIHPPDLIVFQYTWQMKLRSRFFFIFGAVTLNSSNVVGVRRFQHVYTLINGKVESVTAHAYF